MQSSSLKLAPNKQGRRVLLATTSTEILSEMPNPYAIDLRWRIVWAHLAHNLSFSQIAVMFSVSERSIRRYVSLFQSTGDIKPAARKHGPKTVLGEFERDVFIPDDTTASWNLPLRDERRNLTDFWC